MAHHRSAFRSHLKRIGIALILGVLLAVAPHPVLAANWSLTPLPSLTGLGARSSNGEILIANDGNLYGTSDFGNGANSSINIRLWKMTPGGILTTLHTFLLTEGYPGAGLIQGADGSIYGTTNNDNLNVGIIRNPLQLGSFYKISPTGVFTILHYFTTADGYNPCRRDDYCPSPSLVQGSDGNFYGMTVYGGPSYVDWESPGYGTVFKMTPSGTLTVLHAFNGNDGANPTGRLIQGADGSFYGGTDYGGTAFTGEHGGAVDGVPGYLPVVYTGNGVLFKITSDGVFTTLYAFAGSDGKQPYAGLTLATDGKFYGATGGGGAYNGGTIFSMTATGALTTLNSLHNSDGNTPRGRLLQAPDGNFYGTMACAGGFGFGTIYEVTPAGILTVLHSFDEFEGGEPYGGLVTGPGGLFYGTTRDVGRAWNPPVNTCIGLVYKFGVDSSPPVLTSIKVVPPFASVIPSGGQRFTATGIDQFGHDLAAQPSFTWAVSGGGAIASGLFRAGPTPGGPFTITVSSAAVSATANTIIQANPAAPTLTTLFDFKGNNNESQFPGDSGSFVAGSDGNFYGTKVSTSILSNRAEHSSSTYNGMIYRITPAGVMQTVHQFNLSDGKSPTGGLLLANDGNFYGQDLGDYDHFVGGGLFKMTQGGVITTLANFSVPYISTGFGHLIQGTDGNFYQVGKYYASSQYGFLYRMTPSGTITRLLPLIDTGYGNYWNTAIQGTDGNFYISSILYTSDGPTDAGSIIRITPDGIATQLCSFDGLKGDTPASQLLQASDGNFYGTTIAGGPNWTISDHSFGTVYKLTPTGTLTTLHAFNGLDGSSPEASLMQASDGDLYGATGGLWNSDNIDQGYGSLYKISLSGVFTTLYTFNGVDGSKPEATLFEGPDGNFYGTTSGSTVPGISGTVYRLNTGLKTPSEFDVTPDQATIQQGSTQQFSVAVLDQYGAVISPQPAVTWTVSGGGTIDANGLFTSNGGGGSFTVTATSGSISGTATITVLALTTITVTPSTATVAAGTSQQFTAAGKDQNGNPMSPQPSFTWSVSGGGSINASGLFTASNSEGGPYTVTATSGSISGTATVTVFVPVLTTITVSPSPTSVSAGASQQFTAAGKDQNGNPMAFPSPVSWSVSGGGTISATGHFTAASSPGGPYTVTAASGSITGLAAITIAPNPMATDFNGDGSTDLVLQNSATNQAALWFLKGGTVMGGRFVSATPPLGWRVAGAADFNGDGKTDLVLQNTTTYQVAIWTMSGATVTGGQFVAGTPPGPIGGVGDFNGDGKPDIAFQQTSDNKVVIWTMNGTAFSSAQTVSAAPPADWKLIGSADFNQDSHADLVLQNTTTRQVALWYLSGTTVIGGNYLSLIPPAGWTPAAFGDYNGDGQPDIALQNTTTNQIAFWYVNGSSVMNGQYLSVTPAAEWRVAKPR